MSVETCAVRDDISRRAKVIRGLAAVVVCGTMASLAHADGHGVALDGVYANSRGCLLANGQDTGSPETIILSTDRFRFYDDECTDVQISALDDGTFEVSAQCEIYDGSRLSLVPFGDRDGFELLIPPSGYAEALNRCQ